MEVGEVGNLKLFEKFLCEIVNIRVIGVCLFMFGFVVLNDIDLIFSSFGVEVVGVEV